MPLSRTGSYLDILLWLILSLCWWAGGWLVATHVFRLRHRERFFAGAAIGLLLFILLSNFLLRGVALETAYWGAALLILGSGDVHRAAVYPLCRSRARTGLSISASQVIR